jgi:hypothetical protein
VTNNGVDQDCYGFIRYGVYSHNRSQPLVHLVHSFGCLLRCSSLEILLICRSLLVRSDLF